MAALNIAFEAPELADGAAAQPARPIDLLHLAQQTMGDKALELEVLQMFSSQTRQVLRDLALCEGPARAALAHRLKGSARSIGAAVLGDAAEALEADPADAGALAGVVNAVIEAENFILGLCR